MVPLVQVMVLVMPAGAQPVRYSHFLQTVSYIRVGSSGGAGDRQFGEGHGRREPTRLLLAKAGGVHAALGTPVVFGVPSMLRTR